jgi:hypothetical protein
MNAVSLMHNSSTNARHAVVAGGVAIHPAFLHSTTEEPLQVLPLETRLHAFQISAGEASLLCFVGLVLR